MRAKLILRLQEDIKGPEKKEIITEQIVELVLSTDKDQFRQMFDNMIAMTIEDTSNRLFGEHGEKTKKIEEAEEARAKKAEAEKAKKPVAVEAKKPEPEKGKK